MFQASLKQWNLGHNKRTDFPRQSTNRKRNCNDAVTDIIAMSLVFSVENLINCVHNEPSLRDVHVDASEEDKELAWYIVATNFGFLTDKQWHCSHR